LGVALEVFLTCIRRNRDEFAEAYQDAGKRLGNDQTIPGIEHPSAVNGDVKHAEGNAGGAGQRGGTGLYFAARAARAIEGEGDGPTVLKRATQTEQGAYGVAAAGAFDGDESESADDASHVFAVVTVAAHHTHANVTTDVGCRNLAGVPQGNDERALVDGLLRAFFAGHADAQGGADETNEPVSGGDDDAEDDSLAEGKTARAGRDFGGGGFAGAGFGHEDIVAGVEACGSFAPGTAEGGCPHMASGGIEMVIGGVRREDRRIMISAFDGI